MKTIRTIAAVLLAAFMVFGPAAANAQGVTVTVATNASSYSGSATIDVSGTVSPAPTAANTAVVITTKGPAGVVDTNEAPVAASTGTYTYAINAGGSPMWVSGTYTVNATYGGPSGSGSQTATFTYTSSAATGSSTTVTTTVTSTVTSAVSTATVTTTVASSDAAALASIQSSLATLTTSVNSLTSTVGSIQTAVNSVSTAVTQLNSAFTGISGNISTLNNVGGQLTSLTGDVNNNQTYVLVVAALAAIVLVLELAILVRKLS